MSVYGPLDSSSVNEWVPGGGASSRPTSGKSDKSAAGPGTPSESGGGGKGGSRSRPLSARPMWRNPQANNRPVSPGSPGA